MFASPRSEAAPVYSPSVIKEPLPVKINDPEKEQIIANVVSEIHSKQKEIARLRQDLEITFLTRDNPCDATFEKVTDR